MLLHLLLFIMCFCAVPRFNSRYPLWLLGIFIGTLIFGIRVNYGNDFESYSESFYLSEIGVYFWGMADILYVFFIEVSPSFEFFIFVTTFLLFLSIALVGSALPRHERFFFICLYFLNPFIFLMQLSAIRQSIAISFVNFAAFLIIKNKNKLSFVLSSIASLAHSSAIVSAPALIVGSLLSERISKVYVAFFAFTSVILGLYLFPYLENFLLSIEQLSGYIHYLEEAEQGSLMSFVLSVMLLSFIIIRYDTIHKSVALLSIFGLIVKLISTNALMLSRIVMYFDVFILISFSFLLFKERSSWFGFWLFGVLTVTYIFRYIKFFVSQYWVMFHDLDVLLF
ncbi:MULTISPECIES: EpsG family protein [Pseudidiomarina]|uniref:EpsG-like putative glucosyltransferase n=2 Tax=Pseudidiomarina TaxID=2800384 RepID=A0A368UJP6_9GAMM|nr:MULTISPECIES: EpsG family protein [Pseudidiomarina]PWW06857.1 EpsG-like putative glucosyltransferase [Pseudidiomarina maritima]RBP86599.1 EpsG-like putative glucosyltransferase [Pseudidiomarina tainanensis]RCW28876.1 EpsG-like putative glucosyltransferase [Pseudidiomarina tainanensis]